MHRRWIAKEIDTRARDNLSRALSTSGLLAGVLAARGMTDPDEAREFLQPSLGSLPDPGLLPAMQPAVERLVRAALSQEVVWIYTDYDVDGVTSAALLSQFMDEVGIRNRVWLPRRDREGYGLHAGALTEIAGQGGTLVVTADCGVTAVAEAEIAAGLGLDLIITDHHTPGRRVPETVAVVNPKLPGCLYPDAMLAGVGVAWNLCAGLRRGLRDAGYFSGQGPAEPDIRTLLDLVAIGTVADVVPLCGVNRILVAYGMQVLNRSPRIGVRALQEVAGVRGPLRAGHIGFQIGPRLNAAGRMEGPQEALDLLAGTDEQEVARLSVSLDELNRKRQAEEKAILDAALARVEDERWSPQRWSLVLEAQGWHPGVIGIVASRLTEKFHRPTVVLAVEDRTAKGSGRSIRGLNLVEALGGCADLLTRFGGHAAAAGLELPADRVGEFRDRFEAVVRSRLREEDLRPLLQVDAEIGFGDLTVGSVRDLEQMEPFGFGNPSPRFITPRVRLLDVRAIGRNGDHLAFRLEHDGLRLDAVGWRKADGLGHLQRGMEVDVAYAPQVDTWGGRERVRLDVEGMRPV